MIGKGKKNKKEKGKNQEIETQIAKRKYIDEENKGKQEGTNENKAVINGK